MTVLSLGLNHTTASVDLRGKFAFAVDQLNPVLRSLHDRFQSGARAQQPEVALLSTCNRTELYCAGGEPQQALEWLADHHQLNTHDLTHHTYTLDAQGAVRHAFRVASGLDSMVLEIGRAHV